MSRDRSSVAVSVIDSSQPDFPNQGQNTRDAPVPGDSQTQTEDERNPESEQVNGGDGDSPSDEENEELSASSIEVLGTLLRYVGL